MQDTHLKQELILLMCKYPVKTFNNNNTVFVYFSFTFFYDMRV